MSLYEVLVFVALLVVGGYAWYLYRKDSSRQPATKPVAGSELMFGRDRTKPGGKD
jgi:hypothetical protein